MLKGGERFQYQSVVDSYHNRPEYPEEIYEQLKCFIPESGYVLDIGCGPGKLSYPLAEAARQVDAVDLSAAMINQAKADPRNDGNIRWLVGDIQELPIGDGYDLMVAGASIHWMDLDSLFPCLAPQLSKDGVVAFLAGDEAFNPPWGAKELGLMKAVQIEINSQRPEWVDRAVFPRAQKSALVVHPLFIQSGSMQVKHNVRMTVGAYIDVIFSRQSFAEDCMPSSIAHQFRRDMEELLDPFRNQGFINYEVDIFLEWGKLIETSSL